MSEVPRECEGYQEDPDFSHSSLSPKSDSWEESIQLNGQHTCKQSESGLHSLSVFRNLNSTAGLSSAVPLYNCAAHRLTLTSGVHRTNRDSWDFPKSSSLLFLLRPRETNGNIEPRKKGYSHMLREADGTRRFLPSPLPQVVIKRIYFLKKSSQR